MEEELYLWVTDQIVECDTEIDAHACTDYWATVYKWVGKRIAYESVLEKMREIKER